MHDFRLVPAALVVWLSTWLTIIAGRHFDAPWVVAGILVLCALALAVIRTPRLSSLAVGLAVVVGVLAPVVSAARVQQLSTSPVAQAARENGFVYAVAALSSDPATSATTTTAYARIMEVTFRGTTTRVRTPVQLRLTDESVGLLPGTTLHISGTAGASRVGDRAAAVIDVHELTVASAAPRHQQIAGHIRAGLRRAVAGRPDDAAALLPSLAIGDTSLVSQSLKDAMRASGLSHLTVVSGANVTIILLAVFVPLTLLKIATRIKAAIAFVVLICFVVVARPDPSVLRAAVMGTIALLAIIRGFARNLSGGSHRSLAALSSAIIVLVLWDPWLATSWGFALSVAATAGLVLGARPLSMVLRTKVPVRLRYLPDALAVTVVAQLSVAPLLIAMGAQVSVVSIPANVLAAPAVAPATISGLSAAALSPVWPLAAKWAAVPGTWATGWISYVARKAHAVDLPHLPTWIPDDAAIVMCDVGQGTSVVVRGRAGHALVFDVGPDPELIDDCLDRLGVQVIDLLVLTHFHADHVEGLRGVLRHRDVSRLLTSPLLSPRAQADAVKESGIAISVAGKGQVWKWHDVRIDVLWPGTWLDSPSPENDHSVVCLLTIGSRRLLLTGDIELAAQRMLAPSLHPVDVMTMPHHGSAKQSPRFAQAVHPRVVLIPVGRNNDYGHPHHDAVTLYQSLGATIGRTDIHGTLAVAIRRSSLVVLAKP